MEKGKSEYKQTHKNIIAVVVVNCYSNLGMSSRKKMSKDQEKVFDFHLTRQGATSPQFEFSKKYLP